MERAVANRRYWDVITPDLLAELPDRPGTVQIANLVRNVILIAAAPEGIGAAVRKALSNPGVFQQAHCLRFEISPEASARAEALLGAYRRRHGGMDPPAQQPPDPTRSEKSPGPAQDRGRGRQHAV